MNVELNIKEMLELGKKAKAAGRGASMEADTISIGSRYLFAHRFKKKRKEKENPLFNELMYS